MLALALLDRILSIDRQNQWLVYVCNSGYLRSLVESLRQDDVGLQSLLTPQPPLLKQLYIYESKMVRRRLRVIAHHLLFFHLSQTLIIQRSSLRLKPLSVGLRSPAVCFQALLTRVAKTGQGAVELLRCGLVAQLIECQVFDMVPDSDAHR